MDYEKVYNEALEQAKFYYGNCPSESEKKKLEKMFPVLKESEDERIRKEIIEAVENWLPYDRVEEIRAYFERQKEQTCPRWIHANYSDKPEIRHTPSGTPYLQNGSYMIWLSDLDMLPKDGTDLTNPGREHPVNMIQWTGNNLKEVIAFTGKSPRFEEWFKSWEEFETYVHQHNNILKLFCEDGSHYEVPVGAWIVKTPDGYNVPSVAKYIQQPAEWSEEDEKALNRAINICKNDFGENSETASFLKSLPERFNLQPKQEWSDEDELFLGVCKNALSKYERSDKWDARIISNWLENRLKSLRPQFSWKPSEQQMKSLSTAYRLGKLGKTDMQVLQSLYEQLKRL